MFRLAYRRLRGPREPGGELHRAGLRPLRTALVRAAWQRHLVDALPAGHLRPRRHRASLHGFDRSGPGGLDRARLLGDVGHGLAGDPLRHAPGGGSSRDARVGIDAHRRRRIADRLRAAGATTRRCRSIRPTTAPSGTPTSTTPRARGATGRRASAPSGCRSARGSSSTTSRPEGERVGARPCPETAGGGAGRVLGLGPARLRPRFAGCSRQEPSASAALPFAAVRYQDLVVDQALYGTFDPATGVHTCADESRDSFVLAAGETRAFTVRLARPSELLVGACWEGVAGAEPRCARRRRRPGGEAATAGRRLANGVARTRSRMARTADHSRPGPPRRRRRRRDRARRAVT